MRLRFLAVPALLLAALGGTVAAETPRQAATAQVEEVAGVSITVDDLAESVAFFRDLLGFRLVSETEHAGDAGGLRTKVATLELGSERIELSDVLGPGGLPFPAGSRANDAWFQHIAIVVSDMDGAYAKLRAAGVEHASTAPQTLPDSIPAAAGIRAFYFRDPDGHFLELLQFPPGKGEARWQSKEALFLGIDHTAIVVADTDRALGFYRDALGLHVAGESRNFGREQEQLNNVAQARLRITTLRAARGPGVELLEYLAPRDGRAAEPLPGAADLAFWKTRMLAHAASQGLLRDPDGHAVELLPLR